MYVAMSELCTQNEPRRWSDVGLYVIVSWYAYILTGA